MIVKFKYRQLNYILFQNTYVGSRNGLQSVNEIYKWLQGCSIIQFLEIDGGCSFKSNTAATFLVGVGLDGIAQ